MEPVINKLDNNKSYYQEKSNLSENSFLNNTNKVSIKYKINNIKNIKYYIYIGNNKSFNK